jgi:hypothetical protein
MSFEDPEMSGGTLIDRLLEEQQALTAGERFAQKHERADFFRFRPRLSGIRV